MTKFINLNNPLSQVTISDCNIPWLDDSEVLISCTTLQQDNEQSTENILLAAFFVVLKRFSIRTFTVVCYFYEGAKVMEFVQPIRDKKKIQQVKAILKGRNYRDYALFTLGINSGLRVSDLLSLKVSHVLDEKGRIKDRITLREKKLAR